MGLKIGLDIDGVVADSFPVFRRELNKHFGKDIFEINSYDMSKLYNIPADDLNSFFVTNMEYLFLAPNPKEGVVETIQEWLKAGHQIVYVTARKKGEEERITQKWFDRYEIPREKTVFVGSNSKTIAIKEFSLDVFVDDFLSNAVEISELGVPVFLMDAPYNQGKLPQGVTRCFNWQELNCHIRRINEG